MNYQTMIVIAASAVGGVFVVLLVRWTLLRHQPLSGTKKGLTPTLQNRRKSFSCNWCRGRGSNPYDLAAKGF